MEDDETGTYMIIQCLENRSGFFENYYLKRHFIWIWVGKNKYVYRSKTIKRSKS